MLSRGFSPKSRNILYFNFKYRVLTNLEVDMVRIVGPGPEDQGAVERSRDGLGKVTQGP